MGSAALRLSSAEAAIAASAAFRARVGAASLIEAKKRIFFDQVAAAPEDLAKGTTLETQRPCAILAIDKHGYIQIGEGAQILLGGTGAVLCIFTDTTRLAADHKASYLDFLDWISQVMDEVAAESGRNENWPFNAIDMWLDPWRPSIGDREADDFWLGGYVLSDHINAGA